MNRLVLMPFARRADGIIVGIDDLSTSERGAACGCTCLSCGLPVIARMGQHNKSCFAHDYHAKADSERCTYSPETVIRIVMMDVLPKLGKLPMRDGSFSAIKSIHIEDHADYDAWALIGGLSHPVYIEIPPPGRLIAKVASGITFHPGKILSSINGSESSRSSIVAAMLQDDEKRAWEWLPYEEGEVSASTPENLSGTQEEKPRRMTRKEVIQANIQNALNSLPDDPYSLEADAVRKYLGIPSSNTTTNNPSLTNSIPNNLPRKGRVYQDGKKCHLCNTNRQEYYEFCNKCKGMLITVSYESEAKLAHAIKYGTIKLHEQRLLLAKRWPQLFGSKKTIERTLLQWLETLKGSMTIANVPCRDEIRRSQRFISIKLERPFLLITWENGITSKVLPQASDTSPASEMALTESFLYLPLDGDPQWFLGRHQGFDR